jgi:hypothetical protein
MPVESQEKSSADRDAAAGVPGWAAEGGAPASALASEFYAVRQIKSEAKASPHDEKRQDTEHSRQPDSMSSVGGSTVWARGGDKGDGAAADVTGAYCHPIRRQSAFKRSGIRFAPGKPANLIG